MRCWVICLLLAACAEGPAPDAPCDLAEAPIWFADLDGDGHGDPETAAPACTQPDATVAVGDDCDDADEHAHPGADEVAYDGHDNDCDPLTPDDDLDDDSFALAVDCDDDAADVNPAATEIPYDGTDNDCDPLTPDDDLDGDSFALAVDCDDDAADVNPAATEIPYDGADNDCDALTPDDDLDGDGFLLADDCDDDDPAVSPSVAEVAYDGTDNDCDPLTPDDDVDGDGFVLADDCDDDDGTVHPDADETAYDGVDNDCDPLTVDDDLDGDGFGVAEDCDDTDGWTNPYAPDLADDGVDSDCDTRDDADPANVVFVSADGDDDNAGTAAAPVRRISRGIEIAEAAGQPLVYVADGLYRESLTLRSTWLIGGFDDTDWSRTHGPVPTVVVMPPAGSALQTAPGADLVVVDGFHFVGVDTAVYIGAGGPKTILANSLMQARTSPAATEGVIAGAPTVLINDIIEAGTGGQGTYGLFVAAETTVFHAAIHAGESAGATTAVYMAAGHTIRLIDSVVQGSAASPAFDYGLHIWWGYTSHASLVHNAWWEADTCALMETYGGLCLSDAAALNTCSFVGCDEAVGNVSGDPLFDPAYRPGPGSTVLGAGVDPAPWYPVWAPAHVLDALVATDFEGDPRPLVGADLGPDQDTCGGACSDCVDYDLDGRGPGCAAGPDCDPLDPELWSQCTTCADADGDGAWAGCDLYVTRVFDCDDTTARVRPNGPDLQGDGADWDCDGLDGPAPENVAWVAKTGSDAGPGTAAQPFLTIGAAVASGRRQINVGQGTWTETVWLVDQWLLGGFHHSDGTRDLDAYESVIDGAVDLSGDDVSVLDGVTVFGPSSGWATAAVTTHGRSVITRSRIVGGSPENYSKGVAVIAQTVIANSIIDGGTSGNVSDAVVTYAPTWIVGNNLYLGDTVYTRGVYVSNSAPVWVANNAIIGSGDGDGVYIYWGVTASVHLAHNDLWNTGCGLFEGYADQCLTPVQVDACAFAGCAAAYGHLDLDPMIDASDHLLPGSPLWNAGATTGWWPAWEPALVAFLALVDRDGQARPIAAWNIGADE